jgi:hypothetical protein
MSLHQFTIVIAVDDDALAEMAADDHPSVARYRPHRDVYEWTWFDLLKASALDVIDDGRVVVRYDTPVLNEEAVA